MTTTNAIELSRKQRRALARSTKRVNLLEGSIRSGKTFIMLARWFTFISTDAPKRGALLMVGKTRESVYRNVFEPLENDPTLAVFAPFVSYRQGAPTALILGRTVHIMGAADAKAESKLRGMTLGGAFVDELTMLPKEFYKQLLGRMSVPGAMMFATTNPDAPLHWLKADYLDKISEFPDWYIEHFTMDDNPGLEREFVESLKREYTGLWYKRFIQGLWVAAEGAIFPEFDSDAHVITRAQLPNIERVLMAGLDYGTTHRTRAYLIGTGRNARGEMSLYVLSEFAPETATVGQHAAMFRHWLASSGFTMPDWVCVDPAAAVMRQQLFDDGMTSVMRAHNSVLPGIQTISSLFAGGRLYVVDSCEHLIKGLPGYRWDSAASKRGDTRPIKENDDEVDALRYAIYTSRRFWRGQIPLAPALGDETIDEREIDGPAR
jgi:PBSX family phage terminase large subunit